MPVRVSGSGSPVRVRWHCRVHTAPPLTVRPPAVVLGEGRLGAVWGRLLVPTLSSR